MANPVVGMPNCGLYQVKSLPVTERVILALLEQSYVVDLQAGHGPHWLPNPALVIDAPDGGVAVSSEGLRSGRNWDGIGTPSTV
jgi:hypothetical protein